MRLLRHLEIVVVEADRAEADRDEQHDPDIGALEARPQQRRGEQAEQDHQAAHRRRALLGEKVRRRPVGADRLALALLEAQRRDDHRAEEEDQEQPGRRRAERAEREVAEQVEERRNMREVGQPGQHRCFLLPRAERSEKRSRSAATSGPMRLPFEPLIITTSPPRSAAAAVRPAISRERSAQPARIAAGAAS